MTAHYRGGPWAAADPWATEVTVLDDDTERLIGPVDYGDSYEPALVDNSATTFASVRRLSGAAVIGTILAVTGICGALTGVLAPEAFVVSALAGLFSAVAFVGTAHRRLAGRGLACVSLLFSVAGMLIALLAISKALPWPNSAVNEVSRWHAWLAAHLTWVRR